MLLSIIIINYKTSNLVSQCIDSIEKLLGNDLIKNAEIIVVDNNSGENEVKSLQKLRDEKGFKLLISQQNIGFGAGCNFATTIAKGEIFLFLNSDTKVKSGILEMAGYLKDKNRILGGKLINLDGNTEKSAGKFLNIINLFTMLFLGGERGGLIRFAPEKIKKVDWVSGGFLMVKKKMFEELNGFDENYFMYVEDMDICLRAKKLGHDTYYFPDAQVIHEEHGSSNRRFAIISIYTSLLAFYKKNKSNVEYSIARFLLKLKANMAILVGKILGKEDVVKTYEEALRLFR